MKETIAAMILAVGLVGGAFVLADKDPQPGSDVPVLNATIIDGVQVVDITAKGGYSPRKSIAKAGIPTIVRFTTSGTFDCSAALRIPSEDVNVTLPPSGTTDVDIGVPKPGVLSGSCGMGMYPFEIEFQEE
ncbi:MAG: hypothetical protein KBD16_04390 [Candidatus Pacebacteria bacterium]|nr:hypothetical protein [Candidatus Paceibacterota bacterium]